MRPYGYVSDLALRLQTKWSSLRFYELVSIMDPKMREIASKFPIKGKTADQVWAIAVTGLKKAVRDFEPTRFGNWADREDALFTRFAWLVIRRKLANALKESSDGQSLETAGPNLDK